MPYFSLSIFKKSLERRFYFSTLTITFSVLFLYALFNLPIFVSLPSARLLFFTVIPLFTIALGLILVQTIKKEDKMDFWTQFRSYLPVLLPITGAGSVIFLIDLILFSLKQLPYIGTFFKVLFCVIDFAFYFLIPIVAFVFVILLFHALLLLGKNSPFQMRLMREELRKSAVNQKETTKKIVYAGFPLALVLVISDYSFSSVISAEKGGIYYVLSLILIGLVSGILTPFVNYFFFTIWKWAELEKKH